MNKLEADIREMSDKAFKDHVITERMRSGVFRQWRCQKPGSWMYGFYITTIPGSLIITGDLGCLVVSGHYDMLPWCRGSIDSTDYFASKVEREIATHDFAPDILTDWIKEELKNDNISADNRELLEDALDMGVDSDGPDYWYRHFEDVWQGCDPPNWNDFKPGFLWLRDAIRWFVTNHSETEVTQ